MNIILSFKALLTKLKKATILKSELENEKLLGE
jgi:hypothetical protein